jgi:hypothetical protein
MCPSRVQQSSTAGSRATRQQATLHLQHSRCGLPRCAALFVAVVPSVTPQSCSSAPVANQTPQAGLNLRAGAALTAAPRCPPPRGFARPLCSAHARRHYCWAQAARAAAAAGPRAAYHAQARPLLAPPEFSLPPIFLQNGYQYTPAWEKMHCMTPVGRAQTASAAYLLTPRRTEDHEVEDPGSAGACGAHARTLAVPLP